MREQFQRTNTGNFLDEILEDLSRNLLRLIKSESQLIQLEIYSSVKKTGKHYVLATCCAIISLLGVLPFIFFLTLGLGALLHHNYWLSSLIVSLFLMVFGAFGCLYFINKIQFKNGFLPSFKSPVKLLKRPTSLLVIVFVAYFFFSQVIRIAFSARSS